MIYVVTRGDYSDYRIYAVFTERELAELWIGAREADEYDPYTIEEWPENPNVEYLRAGLKVYEVYMDQNGDNTVKLGDWSSAAQLPKFYILNPLRKLRGTLYAKSPEHAVKIVNEKRVQLLALNRWTPGEV